jgi:hypothetical protein
MLPPNTIPAPPGKFPKPDPTAPAPLAPGEPELDFTALSPPLRPKPPNPRRRGPRRHALRTAWGSPDPLDPHLLPARPWQPMTDAEWDAIAPHLWASGCGLRGGIGQNTGGRPMPDPRGRLDAIFRGCTLKWQGPHGAHRAPWRALPQAHGKADTVSHTHRRWAHATLWRRLLEAAFDPFAPEELRGMAHWICCAYRRAIRVMGLTAVTFARRLRLHSALPAPPHWLPDEDLHAPWRRLVHGLVAALGAGLPWRPPPGIGGVSDLPLLWDRVIGRRPLPRWAEPA